MAKFQQELDVRNESCPMPVMKTNKAMKKMEVGEVLHVIATDPASVADILALTDTSGDKIIEQSESGGEYHFYIKRT